MAKIDNFGVLAEGGNTSGADKAVYGFVRTLAEKSRPGDIIGHTDRSEFVLILTYITRTDAGALEQAVCRSAGWNFTVSAGPATYPRDASDAEGLIEKARESVMVAKSRCGNTVVLPS